MRASSLQSVGPVTDLGVGPPPLDERHQVVGGAPLAAGATQTLGEGGNGPVQPRRQIHRGCPSEDALGPADVRAALGRIVLRQGTVLEGELTPAPAGDLAGQLADGELARGAQIDRIAETLGRYPG